MFQHFQETINDNTQFKDFPLNDLFVSFQDTQPRTAQLEGFNDLNFQCFQKSYQESFISTFDSLSGTAKWFGGVLAPNGKIYGIPYASTTVLEIDPETKTTSTFGSLSGADKWVGGVLAPNGKIYGIPYGSTTVLEIEASRALVTNGMYEIPSHIIKVTTSTYNLHQNKF